MSIRPGVLWMCLWWAQSLISSAVKGFIGDAPCYPSRLKSWCSQVGSPNILADGKAGKAGVPVWSIFNCSAFFWWVMILLLLPSEPFGHGFSAAELVPQVWLLLRPFCCFQLLLLPLWVAEQPWTPQLRYWAPGLIFPNVSSILGLALSKTPV